MFGFSAFAEVPFADLPATTPSGINYSLTCAVGTYSVTGKTSNLLVARKLSANTGSYSTTGKAATFLLSHKLTGAAGAYSVTGKAATFSLTTNYILPCLNGSYTLTGTDSYIQYYKGIWALESDTSLDAWSVEASTPNVWTIETPPPITWN